ncbi:MAG: FtsX-like permease family protein [Bacteroidota bacterium]
MFNHHFKFLFRRLWRQKLHTFSHLIGLTLGLTVCLLIGLFLYYELSFDAYHEKADRIYRMNQVWENASGEKRLNYGAPGALAEALRLEVTGLEEVTTVYPRNERILETENKERFMQEGIMFVEANFLDIFDVKVLKGNAREALQQPWQTLLTNSTAKKIFGTADPIGRTLRLDNKNTLTVAGIIEDFPDNTHLPANVLISYFPNKDYLGFNPNSWMFTFGASTYVLLEEGVNPVDLEASVQTIYDKNFNDGIGKKVGDKASAIMQPLSQIHFETQYGGGGAWVKAINSKWLWFFSGVGLIVLALACINFVNLSTAQSLSRAKEVGVRKAIGAARSQLVVHFMNESFLLMTFATILAFGVAYLILPVINTMLDRNIDFGIVFHPIGLLFIFSFFMLVSLLTGIYPAWLIAKFQPATSLKTGKNAGDGKSPFLRKILITTQFTVSGALLIALIFISQQMKFFYQKSLGFDKENIITFEVPDLEKIDVLSNELDKIKGVKKFSFNSSTPSDLSRNGTVMHLSNLTAEDRKDVDLIFGDETYSDLFDLSLLAGRFYKDSDTSAISASLEKDQLFPKVLVNEQLLETMNLGTPEQAIGTRFKIGYYSWQPEIVGVLKNFVTSSLHKNIDPIIIMQSPEFLGQASLKLNASNDLPATLAEIQTVWERTFPDQVYDHKFLDEQIELFYESENLLFSFFKIFAGLAMLISCIGLWGLATHTAVQRTKEIGIRKVLGASVTNLVGLLAKDFVKLVIIGLIIAIPLTWYLVNQWLQNFAYAIELKWWVFALAAFTATGVALLTVSIQSVKTAISNPIEALRNE